MTATVTSVKFNVPRGSYKVTMLNVTSDKGEDKEYAIFSNAKCHNVVSTLKAGDKVEITMVKNGKYWNVDEVKKLDTPAPSYSGGGTSKVTSGDKDIAIARAVTIKAATEIYAAMITAGLTKKTLKTDAAAEEVLALCKKFEGYLTLAEDLNDLTADNSSLQDEGGSYEEVPFD